MKDRPIVWVIKEQVRRGDTGPEVIDYSAALQFGDLEFITKHDIPLYNGSTVGEQWVNNVAEWVQQYDDEKDYIITTGQPIAIFLTGFMLSAARKAPRFLVWRREHGAYVPFDPMALIEGPAHIA